METNHRFIDTNSIKMHIAEQGKGPLVVLCHGFPELGYTWKHQLPALAEAGFHAVAPDQRGYGKTDCPESIEDYAIMQLVGDIVGLVHALEEEKAVIVGHDWGMSVAYNCALLRPDIFEHLVIMTRPFWPRQWGNVKPTEEMRQLAGNKNFYIDFFQEPGKAESQLELDVRKTMMKMFYTASGDPPPERRWNVNVKNDKFINTRSSTIVKPSFLTDEDIDVYTEAFERTGFRGPLNWYRNIDRNWEMTPFLSGAKIHQPSLYIGGEVDSAVALYWKHFEEMEKHIPNLKRKILIPGAGHFVQMERPQEVNQYLLEFLNDVKSSFLNK